MLNITIVLVDCIMTLLGLDYAKFQELVFDTLQSRNVCVKSVGTKLNLRIINLKFLYTMD